MNGNELISFQIISAVGTARSMYVEAIQEAKKGNIQAAKQLIEDGTVDSIKVIKALEDGLGVELILR